MSKNFETRLEVIQSFNVINFGTNRCLVYDFIWAINNNFRFIFPRFRDITDFVLSAATFPYPTPIPPEIWGIALELNK